MEVQRQLHDLEATLEMNPGQELSDDEARLVEQLENLKLEFREMLYELRHKLNVHVTSDVIDDVSRASYLNYTFVLPKPWKAGFWTALPTKYRHFSTTNCNSHSAISNS